LVAIILSLWLRELRADELDDRYDCGFIYDQQLALSDRILVTGWVSVDLIVTLTLFNCSSCAALALAMIIMMER